VPVERPEFVQKGNPVSSRYAKSVFAVIATLVVALVALPQAASASPLPFYGVISQRALNDQDFDAMAEGNVGSYRIVVPWAGVEQTGDGSYDWSGVDASIEATASRRIRALPTVYDAPAWLSYDRREMPVWSGYAIEKWQSMLKAMVARYGPGGDFWAEHPQLPVLPVRKWQIWNEPNIRNFAWPVSPSKYAHLLKVSSTAIKSVDPGAKVMLAGLYGNPPGNSGIDAGPFMNRLYRVHGFRRSFDIAAVHPYASTTRESVARTFSVRRAMNRHGDRRRPIAITEMGWGSDSVSKFSTGSQAAQGRQVTSIYRQLLKVRARLKLTGIFWFSWSDVPDTDHTCVFCYKTGFFDDKNGAKPSWRALMRFTGGF